MLNLISYTCLRSTINILERCFGSIDCLSVEFLWSVMENLIVESAADFSLRPWRLHHL